MKQKKYETEKIGKVWSSPSINKIKIKRITLSGSRPAKKEGHKKYPSPL